MTWFCWARLLYRCSKSWNIQYHSLAGSQETAEAYYNEAAGRIEDEAGRRILAYLGRVERSHQAMIRPELDLIARFPDYYSVEDFHIGEDLFHVGP